MKLGDGLTEIEEIYKSLYVQFPQVWEEPTEDWAELVHRYHRLGIREIPPEPLSIMGTVMTEEDFFAGGGIKDVVCFNNLRYCPPFLHKLEFIKIVYVWRGSVTLYLDEKKYELTSGNFCIITPGVKHTIFSSNDQDMIINILMRESSFSDAFSSILREQNILADFFWKILYIRHSNRVLIFACENNPKLDRWVEKMFDEGNRGENSSNLLMKSYVMIFLGIVMREHLDALRVEELTEQVYVMPEIIQEIRNNLKTITLEELGRKFHMNERELKQYIVKESGYTWRHLLRDLRLRRAVELLENSQMSLEKIVEEIGYSSMSNFYRNFREQFGKKPLEFRKGEETTLI